MRLFIYRLVLGDVFHHLRGHLDIALLVAPLDDGPAHDHADRQVHQGRQGTQLHVVLEPAGRDDEERHRHADAREGTDGREVAPVHALARLFVDGQRQAGDEEASDNEGHRGEHRHAHELADAEGQERQRGVLAPHVADAPPDHAGVGQAEEAQAHVDQ